MLNLKSLKIPDVKLITPKVFNDDRGYFYEAFNQIEFNKFLNTNINFVQDNHSTSSMGVLRGLHFQKKPYAQGKLVRVVRGEVFDVAVDIRKNSKFYAHWVAEILSEKNYKQLWIPEGFAHGFLVLSNTATFSYKTTNYFNRDSEVTVKFNDPNININWPSINRKYILSAKDSQGLDFAEL